MGAKADREGFFPTDSRVKRIFEYCCSAAKALLVDMVTGAEGIGKTPGPPFLPGKAGAGASRVVSPGIGIAEAQNLHKKPSFPSHQLYSGSKAKPEHSPEFIIGKIRGKVN